GDDGAAAGPAPTGTVATVPGTAATTPATEPTTTTTSASTEPTTTTSTTTTPPTTTTTIPTGFTREFRDAFMDGCVGGGNRTFCRCALDAFEGSYTQDDLAAILDGDVPAPDDFSGPSIGCYIELPTSAPLPGFALPNACAFDLWGMVIHYPAGWEVEDETRECFAYRPADLPAGSMPVIVGIYTTTLDEYLSASPSYDYLEEYPNRDVYIWLTEVEGGSYTVEYVFPLWPEIPESPLVAVIAETVGVPDAWTVADMIVKGLEIAPYSP
ncbi:MAG: hypothetical protein KJ698_06055, partial [Actinobacteria bacterium]|nr:hypothetical protein [Actinomycetota bacterium]